MTQQNREEVRILKSLSDEGASGVPQIKPDGRILSFTVEGQQFFGFGMEYFPHGSLSSAIISRTLHMSQPEREEWLMNSEESRIIYESCKAALMTMWECGVIHHDPHLKNILYDPST